MPVATWERGEAVALRYFPGGKLRWVKPVVVVEDSDETIALYLAGDTVIKKPVHTSDGTEINRALSYSERFALDWTLGEGRWRDTSVLMLTRPGLAHSYWAFWRASDWMFLAWYVNLQAPLARTPIGFDTEDHVLDLVIEPDLSAWEWKDEEELEDAIQVGRFTAADARRIRAEGEKALDALNSRAWPFDGRWDEWRPDPSWTAALLDDAWEDCPKGYSTSNTA